MGVGSGDVLAMGRGDSQSACACVQLQGGDVCWVSHPSGWPLGLAGGQAVSGVHCRGLLAQGGGSGGGCGVTDGGLGR